MLPLPKQHPWGFLWQQPGPFLQPSCCSGLRAAAARALLCCEVFIGGAVPGWAASFTAPAGVFGVRMGVVQDPAAPGTLQVLVCSLCWLRSVPVLL